MRNNKCPLNKEYLKKEVLRRGLSLLLSLCMVVSLFCGVVTFPAFAQGSGQEPEQKQPQTETKEVPQKEILAEPRAEIKARLLRQIREEGWDPYSSDMTLDEFYALMELFQEGVLPLTDENPAVTEIPGSGEPNTDEPSIDGPTIDGPTIDDPGTEGSGNENTTSAQPTGTMYIPREMFLFSGVNPDGTTDNNDNDISSRPGKAADGNIYGAPLKYDNQSGATDELNNYPAGLDPYGGYTRPPKGWPGIKVGRSMAAKVVDPGTNEGNTSVSGDVDQSLFLEYDGVYIRRVTAKNNDVTVLGAIKQPKKNESDPDVWVYYYTNKDQQSTEVSATTLPEGEKFVIHYAHEEYSVSYQIRFRATNAELGEDGSVNLFGYDLIRSPEEYTEQYYDKYSDYQDAHPDGADIADWVRQLPRLKNEADRGELAQAIFGDEFPTKTDEGRYAFTATAPDGYTLAFYLASDVDESGTWINGSAQLVTPEGYTGEPGKYTGVNQGWALGMEPVYVHNGDKLMPYEKAGPQQLITTGTFYNNDVTADRIVVAVLRKKEAPKFDAYSYFHQVDANGGYHGIDNNVADRGTTSLRTVKAKIKGTDTEVTIPYDYEDVYLWANNGDSVYDYFENNSSMGGASKGNLQAGNIATGDGWDWRGTGDTVKKLLQDTMTLNEEDGTYSFQWTFQTNSGQGARGFLLDTLEINRVAITIPFFTKNYKNNNGGYNGEEYPAPNPEPDGPGGIRSWFAYTELPDGATVKVELLMAFNALVQRVYRITVTGAKNNVTVTNMNVMMYGTGAAEIAVYELDGITGATDKDEDGNTGGVRRTAVQYYNGKTQNWSDNIIRGEVIIENDGGGTDFNGGDTNYGGANIRFKLANGYSNPCYLLETSRNGTIDGQASIKRDDGVGGLIRGTQNPVVPYVSDGSDPYMRYDDDGVPYPVNKDGYRLYYKDGNGALEPFTDWTALRIIADEAGDVLAPSLYLSDGTPLTKNDVIASKRTPVFQWDKEARLVPQYIYSGTDGWYYIRLTGHDKELQKMALLTIVAFPSLYVVRYKPGMIGAVIGNDNEVIAEATAPKNMPKIQHSSTCPTFLQGDPENDVEDDRVKYEFDDNVGFFYDIEIYTDAPINLTRPIDERGYYKFVDWVLVDKDDNPVRQYVIGDDGNWAVDWENTTDPDHPVYLTHEVHFASGSLNIEEYSEYAILNDDLGTTRNDIYVLRLMPYWEKIDNPYHYKVALNWVDAQGVLHEKYFDDESEGSLWQEVLTGYDQEAGGGPTVKVLTDAVPFQDWIAQHPTYTFWDDVNNVTGTDGEQKELFEKALREYLPELADNAAEADKEKWQDNYDTALKALLNRDRMYEDDTEKREKYYKAGPDFDRLGNYTYAVNEDYGTIVVWMYEDKGGMVFHKAVDAEPFIADDEFYFTVRQVEVGYGNDQFLDGEYKAYPETAYDEFTGAKRAMRDSDAWRVQFVDGNIVNIVKNDGSAWPSAGKEVTYFTVKNGEGIQLYVPGGKYTIFEVGSKSGGSYRTEVTYVDAKTGYEQVPKTGWEFPTDYQWLKGDRKTYDGSDHVSATVQFVVGEHDVARIVNFSNQTSAVAFENLVIGPYQGEQLGYTVTLALPKDATPLYDEEGGYYYFSFNLYDVTYPEGTEAKYKYETANQPDLTGSYAPPDRGTPEYEEWLKNDQAAWLGSEKYTEWLKWHTWRPDGTLSINTTGRVVVTRAGEPDADGVTNWDAQYLLIPETGPTGIITGWKRSTYSGNGVIGLTNGQRFYVVCTVPADNKDINYRIEETDTKGYYPGGGLDRVRTGKAVVAELAYELFKNSKLQGLPATGGMGDGIFRMAGLAFLASGLGLVWLNRDLWVRKRRVPVRASGGRRESTYVKERWGK